MAIDNNLNNLINALLVRAGLDHRNKEIFLSTTGGNNRIYKVKIGSKAYIAKIYFQSEEDSRNRLGSEFAFLSYSNIVAPNSTPAPYVCDAEAGAALYEFIEGRPFQPDDVENKCIEDAITFFLQLNAPDKRLDASSLPLSSEACFSLEEHVNLIDGRIKNLLAMPKKLSVDRSAHDFIKRLSDLWGDLLLVVDRKIEEYNLQYRLPLSSKQRCISPSDFGFHNAIRGTNGRTHFIDFEYAGWDDPSRMAADFFSQPAVPVPYEYFDAFVNNVMAVFPRTEELIKRAYLLLPIYRIKWCCIILNIFLPVNLQRRLYANPKLNENKLKSRQLDIAEPIFNSIVRAKNYGLY